MLVGEGYSSAEIATKLSAIGIKFNLEGDKFTIIDDEPAKEEQKKASEEKATAESEPVTILSCLSDIVENVSTSMGYRDNRFNSKIFSICKKQIKYVCDMIGISQEQAVLLACIIENKGKHNFDKHDLAGAMGLSFIKLLSYDAALKGLSDKRLINIVKDDVISVGNKTIAVLATNKPYSIPECRGLNTAELLKEMNEIISDRESGETEMYRMMEDLDALFENNPDAGIVKATGELGIDLKGCGHDDRVLFYVLVKRYIYNDDDEVTWCDFDDIFDDASDIGCLRSRFNNEAFELQARHIVEPCNENGMASPDSFHLTDDAKAQLFAEVGGVRNKNRRTSLKVIQSGNIQQKELYYNETEGEQIHRLSSLLDQENYKATCERLKKAGMRTGFTCIFYGGPGTGKTESVYQLAKATGRGIVPVNVNEIKSCWVGESEKLIAGVFEKYKAIVRESDVAPILLFNEADAIFGIRQEGAERAVDKMENSIQNIILQQMEELEGVLIATTNLTQNLDKAFERRFLYKVKFDKPGIGPKTKIWKSMIPDLSEDQARELAEGFDFSGGQIENISRKKMIKSIIDGVEPDFKEVKSYCGEELIRGKGGEGRKIGF